MPSAISGSGPTTAAVLPSIPAAPKAEGGPAKGAAGKAPHAESSYAPGGSSASGNAKGQAGSSLAVGLAKPKC